MVARFSREEVCSRLREQLEQGKAILLVGVGSGISAKFSEVGGADLIAVYPIAKYRMAGLSSTIGYLPICDSNQVTLDLGRGEIIPIIKDTPVIGGVLANDPTREMDYYLDQVAAVGFSGVLNCPTYGVMVGGLRDNLEAAGLGYDKEVEMIRLAHQKGLFTQAFVADTDQTRKMVEAGCDMVIAHMGKTAGGTTGARVPTSLDDVVTGVQEICGEAKRLRPEIFVLCHGGKLDSPENVRRVLQRVSDLDGYMGGSTAERLPVEEGIKAAIAAYKELRISEARR